MKKANSQIFLFAAILSNLCFISVLVFKMPAFIKYFDLSTMEASNLGGAVSGLTAPVIGIGSALLLYLALSKQVESNGIARVKNEMDVVFALLMQFQKEVDNFYYSTSESSTKDTSSPKVYTRVYGVEALNEFAFHLSEKKVPSPMRISGLFEITQILMIVRSFEFIKEHLATAHLATATKNFFQKKLNAYFELVLYYPLFQIVELVERHTRLKDFVYSELKAFYENNLYLMDRYRPT